MLKWYGAQTNFDCKTVVPTYLSEISEVVTQGERVVAGIQIGLCLDGCDQGIAALQPESRSEPRIRAIRAVLTLLLYAAVVVSVGENIFDVAATACSIWYQKDTALSNYNTVGSSRPGLTLTSYINYSS